ncbi:MAG TPA: DUF1697 domain-containing protein [Terriglobia bacterium]|nr:DUF1697 domain-containing protein [Terriglobia bacterium]
MPTDVSQPVVICLLRGVNLGGHNKVKMEALRALCESLGLRDVQTYLQSGNVVFRTKERDLARLSRLIEDAIEKEFGFRTDVVLRTPAELRGVIARNPFAKRRDIDPSRVLVTFLAADPGPEAREKVSKIDTQPEELYLDGREFYMYFVGSMARPKISWMAIAKMLKTPGTGRNWNTVRKLLEIADKLEGA